MTLNLAQLTKHIASQLEYPEKSAMVLMRAGRESFPPVFPTRGRGRFAGKADVVNAADLIIGMMTCPSPAKAPMYINDFGNLKYAGENRTPLLQQFVDGYAAADVLKLAGNFRTCIAGVLSALGNPDFARKVVEAQERDFRGNYQPPNIVITIWDTTMMGSVRVDAVERKFSHESIAKISKELDPEEIQRRYAEEDEVSRKYRRRVFSMKSVGNEVLLPIAEALSGRNFRAMLEEAGADA